MLGQTSIIRKQQKAQEVATQKALGAKPKTRQGKDMRKRICFGCGTPLKDIKENFMVHCKKDCSKKIRMLKMQQGRLSREVLPVQGNAKESLVHIPRGQSRFR